jgi:hypothetical protein
MQQNRTALTRQQAPGQAEQFARLRNSKTYPIELETTAGRLMLMGDHPFGSRYGDLTPAFGSQLSGQ